MDQPVSTEIAKASPAAAVATAHLLGFHLPDVVQLLTAIYLLCLCIQFGYRFVKWVRRRGQPA